MKRFALFFAMAAGLSAASWDGQHDDLTVMTVVLNTSIFGLVGAPIPPGMPKQSTEIFVSTTDLTVTGFRVSIQFVDDSGSHTATVTSSISNKIMTMHFFSGVPADQIRWVQITRLHDAATTVVLGERQGG